MNQNMVRSRGSGITRTSSVYGKDFLELVWENGHQILAGDNNRTRNTPFCIGYSVNPSSLKNEDDIIIMRTSKRPKLSNISHKPNEEFPNLKDSKLFSWGTQHPFTAAASNSHTQQTNKPRVDSQKQYLGSCDQRTRKVNFSNFSIPTVFLKSTSGRVNASLARVEKIDKIELKAAEVASAGNKEADDHHSAVIELTKGSHGFQERGSFTSNKSKPGSPVADKSVEPPSSEALKEKGKANNERSSSSVCSLEASNNPNFSSIRKYEDTDDDSAYLSDDDEETENLATDNTNRIKRSRNAESPSLSERKRRDKINEKILALKDLIPNCNKVDKASMLDDAIDYLKTLKFQLEIMSMSRGLCMPLMMLQHQMNVGAQNLMGFRPGNGFPCTPPPQFPIPPLSGVTDNNSFQMFGFSNQMIPPPMPIPNAPLFPMIGNSSIQPFNPTNIVNNSKT